MTALIRERVESVAEDAIAGDSAAFTALYEAMSTSVFNLVMRSVHDREIAEDVCQDVWVKVHREIGTLRSSDALSSWVYRIASRACIDYSRSRACRERGSVEISEEMLEASFDDPEAALQRRSELRLMWEVLATMPPRQSMALYLKQVDGRSYDEIGAILGCPRSAVETLLFRARHGLTRAYERFQADPSAGCKMVASTMAVVLDREGTPIQQRAVEMHVAACRTCRDELAGMKRSVAGYAWLPMLPAGGQALSAALAGTSAGAGAGFGIARLAGMLLANGKASGLAFLTAGAVATAGVTGAAAGVLPSPVSTPGFVQEFGDAVRSVTSGGGEEDGSQSLKAIEDGLAPLDRIEPSSIAAPGSQASQQPLAPLPPAAELDPQSALSGLPGLLEAAGNGTLASVEPLLAFVGGTLGGVLVDPLATLEALLSNPGATLNGITTDATEALNQTTQNSTTTVDTTVDQTTDIVDGLLGENELTGSLDQTIDNATDAVDNTVGGVTGAVDQTTGSLGETLDETTAGLGETLDGLTEGLGDVLPLPPPSGDQEEPDEPEEEEGPCVLGILLCN